MAANKSHAPTRGGNKRATYSLETHRVRSLGYRWKAYHQFDVILSRGHGYHFLRVCKISHIGWLDGWVGGRGDGISWPSVVVNVILHLTKGILDWCILVVEKFVQNSVGVCGRFRQRIADRTLTPHSVINKLNLEIVKKKTNKTGGKRLFWK